MSFSKELRFLAQTLRDADRQDALKPVQVKNDVANNFKFDKDGCSIVTSTRFKTRIRASMQVR